MGSKQTSRREILKSGAALAGGLTLGAVAPALGDKHADTHDHAMASGSQNAYPMIPGSKELVAYGERSHFVTSVRIPHPMGGKPSPDAFGKLFHIASPMQDQVGEDHAIVAPLCGDDPPAPSFRTSIPSSTL